MQIKAFAQGQQEINYFKDKTPILNFLNGKNTQNKARSANEETHC